MVLESAVAYIGPQVAIRKAPPEDKYESDSELIEGESNQGWYGGGSEDILHWCGHPQPGEPAPKMHRVHGNW